MRPTYQSVACQGREGFSEPLTNQEAAVGVAVLNNGPIFNLI